VTANVYRPNQSGRYPAVLLQAGHTQEGKPEAQLSQPILAMKGFVALAYDPVGQAKENKPLFRQLGRPLAGDRSMSMSRRGPKAFLLARAWLVISFGTPSALSNYLLSRPDVDAHR